MNIMNGSALSVANVSVGKVAMGAVYQSNRTDVASLQEISGPEIRKLA